MSADSRDERGGAHAAVASSSMVLRAGFAMSDLDVDGLWIGYAGLGGGLSAEVLEEILLGRRRATNHEHDLIAQALNDHFTDRGQDHPVPYSRDLDPSDD
ncbi:hypothetical protein [Pseudonocardia pini]|uniref:hypothetical protein n=1 Tax=Pseudonocardia pini TaxID=2758030 RepID=UPI0015F051FB|nr:hypothetical protein [Pseudonocardia pini]